MTTDIECRLYCSWCPCMTFHQAILPNFQQHWQCIYFNTLETVRSVQHTTELTNLFFCLLLFFLPHKIRNKIMLYDNMAIWPMSNFDYVSFVSCCYRQSTNEKEGESFEMAKNNHMRHPIKHSDTGEHYFNTWCMLFLLSGTAYIQNKSLQHTDTDTYTQMEYTLLRNLQTHFDGTSETSHFFVCLTFSFQFSVFLGLRCFSPPRIQLLVLLSSSSSPSLFFRMWSSCLHTFATLRIMKSVPMGIF